MTNTIITLQPAFILRHRKYRETSLLLDLLTQDFGVIAVLAKGIRKSKSKSAALLRPFQELIVSCSGKGEGLLLLTQVEIKGEYASLNGLGVYCGFYLNELVLRFITQFDPYPDVYSTYQISLQALSNVGDDDEKLAIDNINCDSALRIELILRLFELKLLQYLGFGLQTDHDIVTNLPVRADAQYVFYPDKGAVEHPQGNVTGKTLLAIARHSFKERAELFEAKRLMRSVIDFHLQGKPLKSRIALSQIYQQL